MKGIAKKYIRNLQAIILFISALTARTSLPDESYSTSIIGFSTKNNLL